MDVILVIMAIFLFLFILAMLCLFCRMGSIPDTLCSCVFAICGGECGVMGWIKTTKEKKRERQEVLEDRQYQEEMMRQQGHENGPE